MRRPVNRLKTLLWAATLVAVVLLAGCASTKTVHWSPRTIDEVIAKFGPPDCTGPVPPSTLMTRYVWVRRTDPPGRWEPTDPGQGTQPNAKVEAWIFLVSPDGVIVDAVVVD